jgi:LPXTG-motif cell wall-anchored protein
MWEFLTSWNFMWILLGALVVLIAIFIFLRMRRKED